MGASMTNMTNRKGFNSQSEADLSLTSQIAHALARHGVPIDQMAEPIERIFGQSGLASREKWYDRDDYRKRTIKKAIEGVRSRNQIPHSQATQAPTNATNHKDVRNAEFFAKL